MATTQKIDWAEKHIAFKAALTVSRRKQLAGQLGVSTASLVPLGVGWSDKDMAWTFPEHDHQRNIVGILRRYPDGEKKVFAGSRRGLYFPKNWLGIPGPIFVPEGVSDVAALLSHGLCAVGRPQCKGGIDELAKLFANTERAIVILGENDQKPDGSWPGRDGAQEVAGKLAGLLGHEVRWALPPAGAKDVRELIVKGMSDGE